jgi:hypothetical protein
MPPNGHPSCRLHPGASQDLAAALCLHKQHTYTDNIQKHITKWRSHHYFDTCFFILLFGVERVSIYFVPLICHNGEYRAMSQLFLEFTCLSIRLRNLIPEPANEFSHVFIC